MLDLDIKSIKRDLLSPVARATAWSKNVSCLRIFENKSLHWKQKHRIRFKSEYEIQKSATVRLQVLSLLKTFAL